MRIRSRPYRSPALEGAGVAGAVRYVPHADVVCDIGGQDIRDFRLSNQCSAGNGMLLQAMAEQFGIPLSD